LHRFSRVLRTYAPNAAPSIATGAGRERRSAKMLIFTLVDEGTVMMDACGARTRTLDNHHSYDSDRATPSALRAGEGQGDTSSG